MKLNKLAICSGVHSINKLKKARFVETFAPDTFWLKDCELTQFVQLQTNS